MIYFIPAWYNRNEWCENEQAWHSRKEHTEFDDTVKHIQLFHRKSSYPYRILLLSYTPNFRHFLHRQGVFHAPYWSCFDSMCAIKRKKAFVLSFHNLNWPKNIEFIYTPFVVLGFLNGQKYAQIEFGEDGNPIRIDMFAGGKIIRRNIYDDRGFLSSTIVFEDSIPKMQDYLSEDGIQKFRVFLDDGHVEINPESNDFLIEGNNGEYIRNTYKQLVYPSLEDVIKEVFAQYVLQTSQSDIFCVAMHALHGSLVRQVLEGRKKILSFFSDRYDVVREPEAVTMIENADYIITDSNENAERIERLVNHKLTKTVSITPYDSRVDFGISTQLNVQKIMVPVDNIEEGIFRELIINLCLYLNTNKNAIVHLFTRNADIELPGRLLENVRHILETEGLNSTWADEEESDAVEENELFEEEKDYSARFKVEQCVDELAVSKCMREQRIMVDLRSVPDLYLQIACISTGIPQIVRAGTEYVTNRKNGLFVTRMNELPDALSYFLDGLANWNEAVVYSYEIGKQYTTEVLVSKWREVIETVG